MKYPDDYINEIMCGNSLKVMKGIPNNSIDLVITDPPYNKNYPYKGYNDNRIDY
jgi:DNA modification methylase